MHRQLLESSWPSVNPHPYKINNYVQTLTNLRIHFLYASPDLIKLNHFIQILLNCFLPLVMNFGL